MTPCPACFLYCWQLGNSPVDPLGNVSSWKRPVRTPFHVYSHDLGTMRSYNARDLWR